MGEIDGREVMLAKPQTFMNLSGTTLKAVMENRRLTNKDLVLVYDELDLPWTALRIKKKGSAGGHNGMKSVIAEFAHRLVRPGAAGHSAGPRIRRWRGVCAGAVRARIKRELDEFADVCGGSGRSIIAEGVVKAMTKFNRRARGLNKRKNENLRRVVHR